MIYTINKKAKKNLKQKKNIKKFSFDVLATY